eukprot:GEMP01005003.1.p1 GENE.GEMP01005003.1~~GEMP01005003.1.p1  ORF type:complete len:750 (+),score=104.02 GEMP01005003.1:142-2391(+)
MTIKNIKAESADNLQDDDNNNGEKRSGSRQFSFSVGSTATKGLNTIFAAIVSNDLVALKQAVKRGIDVNGYDDVGWSPLRKAARLGNREIVACLLDGKADPSANNSYELVTSSSWGRTEVLAMLIEYKGQITGREWETSPLVVAAQNGHLNCIKVLIEAAADVNETDVKGNDALMTAWDFGRSHIVRYLVENGACLKRQEDWERLAHSPSTALNIADGSALNIKSMMKSVEMGEMLASDLPKREVPLRALCAWIRDVPYAALILLDQVLLKTPVDAPTRATLGKRLMRTKYLEVDDWIPKEEPKLNSLAPKDVGEGACVSTQVMQQKGILTTQIFFSLTTAKSQVFKSLVVTAMLEHSWREIVEVRYCFDVGVEFLTLVSLLAWAALGREEVIHVIALVFVGCLVLWDIGEEIRQLKFHRANGEGYLANMFSSTGASFFRWFRLASSFVLIFTYFVEVFGDPDFEHDFAEYKIPLSIVAFTRWVRLLTYIKGYSAIGPKMLPIIKCVSNLTYWFLIFFIMLIASTHSVGVLELENTHLGEALINRFELFTIQKFNPSIFFSRNEHYAQFVGISFPELIDPTLNFFQEVWFVAISFICSVVLFNILIALVADTYDREKEQAWISFLVERADLAFTYFLRIEQVKSSPVEFVYQNILKFPGIDENKYLWMCGVIDEETREPKTIKAYSRSGRLGELSSFLEDAVDAKYSVMCERLDKFEEALQKKIHNFNSELKSTKREILHELEGHGREE